MLNLKNQSPQLSPVTMSPTFFTKSTVSLCLVVLCSWTLCYLHAF